MIVLLGKNSCSHPHDDTMVNVICVCVFDINFAMLSRQNNQAMITKSCCRILADSFDGKKRLANYSLKV